MKAMTTREKLLGLLEENREAYLSGEELAKALAVSRAAVWKAVKSLQQEGYPIDAVTNRGYRLSRGGDRLSAPGIRKYLKPEYRDLPITVAEETQSTNTALRALAEAGAPEGTVYLAQGQTGGRGRMGRSFFSPAGTGLYLSLLLRPTAWEPTRAAQLTAVAAAAMCEAIRQVTGKEPGIKWVNDLLLDGKKICGILTEASFSMESGVLEYAVLGLGVNVYPPEGGFPGQLREIAGAVLDTPGEDVRNRIAGEFLNRFLEGYEHPEDRHFLDVYRRRSVAVGREVTVLSGGWERRAFAFGLDDDCRLLVRYPDGTEQALSYGEIRIAINREMKR